MPKSKYMRAHKMWLFRPTLDPSLEEGVVQEKLAQVMAERKERDDRIIGTAFTSPIGRFASLDRSDEDFQKRWVFPVDKEVIKLVETFDELKIRQEVFEQTLSPWSRFWFRFRVRIAVFLGRLRHGDE